MTIKHTRGPWLLTFGEHDAAIHAGATIAMVDDTMGGWKANARLIAAAPDMLAALVGMVQAMRKALPHLPADHEAVFCGEWLDEANAAILKAKGEA